MLKSIVGKNLKSLITNFYFVFLTDIGYSAKIISNNQATLSPENIENISKCQDSGLTLVPYKKQCASEAKRKFSN